MSEEGGWEHDRDDDGNIIEEKPHHETDPGFFETHWKKIVFITVLIVVLNASDVATFGSAEMFGYLMGTILGSTLLVFIGAWIHSRI